MKLLLKMFFSFAKIGAFTFGGGYAMLPMLQREVVEKNKWATEDELLNYFAVGQCTPGIIAVNTATFVGYKEKGIRGSIFATLGVIFPSVVIIAVISALIQNFMDYKIVQYAMSGIRVCVFVLIMSSVLKLLKKSVKDIPTILIFASVLLLSVFTDISSPVFVIIAGFVGLFLKRGGDEI